jgi:2-polyprenyl-6-methoxyphenol hydroxylase-like FAD-dependent oxidoreductase
MERNLMETGAPWNTDKPPSADVLVVGSGISGTLAASLLGRAGYRVCLIDRHAVYPPDFRAEHLDGPQIAQLRRLGFLDELTDDLFQGDTVALAKSGRVIATAPRENYGLRYEALVNRARAKLPTNVEVVTGRVTSIDIEYNLQRIRMASGRSLTGRLVIVATGQGYALCRQIGITRRIIREAHSLTFGLDLEPIGSSRFEHSFLVYQRERIADRIDYLAAFVMGATTRVNLFTYRDHRDRWTQAFLKDPGRALAEALPGLKTVMGPYRTVGPVVARPTDLYVSEGYNRDGVVLVGDAFESSCPATGMGLVKLLTDVEQLCTRHIPRWLATSGMQAAKITEFYHDSIKKTCDAKALHDATYRRRVSTETTLRWGAHRLRMNMLDRLRGLRRLGGLAHPRIAVPEAEFSRKDRTSTAPVDRLAPAAARGVRDAARVTESVE